MASNISRLWYRYISHSADAQPSTSYGSLFKQSDILRVSRQYTGCPRRNVQDFGRVFLMLRYTDITQNTYIQSWTVTEIMACRKVGASCGSKYCNLHSWCVARQRWWPWEWNAVLIVPAWQLLVREFEAPCKVLGALRTTTALMWVFM